MLNRIETKHLPMRPEKSEASPQAERLPALAKVISAVKTSVAVSHQPDLLGVQLMRERRGEAFANHYYSAWEAAGKIDGDEFLAHYRTLKSCAKHQGMSQDEFRDFERCLYRRFYRAASLDSMQRTRDGRELRVQPEELAYLAKIGGISASQLERDAVAMRRSRCIGSMREIASRQGNFFGRSRGLA